MKVLILGSPTSSTICPHPLSLSHPHYKATESTYTHGTAPPTASQHCAASVRESKPGMTKHQPLPARYPSHIHQVSAVTHSIRTSGYSNTGGGTLQTTS